MNYKPIKKTDVVIVGGGVAGLTAGLYTGRARLQTTIFEDDISGGQIARMDHIDNYPGFLDGVMGFKLAKDIESQAGRYGVRIIRGRVEAVGIDQSDDKYVETDREIVYAKAIILAPGVSPQELNVPGEFSLMGRGVSYYPCVDGVLCAEQAVAIVGGGDEALMGAICLAKYAQNVYMIHHESTFHAEKARIEQLQGLNDKIEILWDSIIEEIHGDLTVESVEVRNLITHDTQSIPVKGVFITIGSQPNTDFLQDIIDLDDESRVCVDGRLQTNIEGIFAAGDVRQYSVGEVVSAIGDGAIAGINARHYILMAS